MIGKFLTFAALLLAPIATRAASVADYGARGDGATDDTSAVQKAVDACAAAGEKLVFPAGTFLTGTIVLRDNTAIELSAKAVWKGIARVDAYPMQRPDGFAGRTHAAWRAMLYAEGADHISIGGAGTLDCNGGAPVFAKTPENPDRPFGLWFVRCRNIRIEGIQMRASAHWMQNYLECDRIRIDGIRVFNHVNLNNDGLDLTDCRDVIVSGARIDSTTTRWCSSPRASAATPTWRSPTASCPATPRRSRWAQARSPASAASWSATLSSGRRSRITSNTPRRSRRAWPAST